MPCMNDMKLQLNCARRGQEAWRSNYMQILNYCSACWFLNACTCMSTCTRQVCCQCCVLNKIVCTVRLNVISMNMAIPFKYEFSLPVGLYTCAHAYVCTCGPRRLLRIPSFFAYLVQGLLLQQQALDQICKKTGYSQQTPWPTCANICMCTCVQPNRQTKFILKWNGHIHGNHVQTNSTHNLIQNATLTTHLSRACAHARARV